MLNLDGSLLLKTYCRGSNWPSNIEGNPQGRRPSVIGIVANSLAAGLSNKFIAELGIAICLKSQATEVEPGGMCNLWCLWPV